MLVRLRIFFSSWELILGSHPIELSIPKNPILHSQFIIGETGELAGHGSDNVIIIPVCYSTASVSVFDHFTCQYCGLSVLTNNTRTCVPKVPSSSMSVSSSSNRKWVIFTRIFFTWLVFYEKQVLLWEWWVVGYLKVHWNIFGSKYYLLQILLTSARCMIS